MKKAVGILKKSKYDRILSLYTMLNTGEVIKKLDIAKIKLGNGVREITAGGKFNAKYNIIIDDIEEI